MLSATASAPREGLDSLPSRLGESCALLSQGVGVPGPEAIWCQHLDPSPGQHSCSPSGSGPLGAGEGLGYWEEHPQPPWSGAADLAQLLTPFQSSRGGFVSLTQAGQGLTALLLLAPFWSRPSPP